MDLHLPSTEPGAPSVDSLIKIFSFYRDAEIRGAALQRLEWDSEIPGDAIRVSVKDGWVTLKGDVVFQLQSDETFTRVASLHGVTGVTNEIRVDEPR